MAQTEDLLFSPDNTYNIGASGGSRPKDIYLGRQLEGSGQVRAKGWFAAGSGIATEIGVVSGEGRLIAYDRGPNAYQPLLVSGSETYLGYSGNKAWKVGSGGHLQAVTDNAYDIGASGANRPRDLYLGRDLYLRQVEASAMVRAKGWFLVGSGLATEIGITGGEGRLISYDRSSSAYQPLLVSGSDTYLGYSGNKAWKVGSGGHLEPVTDDSPSVGSQSKRVHDVFVGGRLKWPASAGSDEVLVLYRALDGYAILRHFGDQLFSNLKIWAPSGALTPREATIALVRGDNDEEFIDIYNNGYPNGNPPSEEYGIRIQKRGTGQWHNFVFDRASLQQIDPPPEPPKLVPEKIFVLRADRNAEFHGSWVRLPQVDNDPTGLVDPDDRGAVWYHKGSKEIRYWAGSTDGVKRVATVP